MSSLAFGTLLLFCLLLPGIALPFNFYRSAANWSAAGTLELSTPRTLVLAVVISLPFHAVWVSAIDAIDRFTAIGRVDVAGIVAVLQGVDAVAPDVIASLNDSPIVWKVFAYLGTQLLAGWYLGQAAATVFERRGWNRRFAEKSNGSTWHRLLGFPGGQPDAIIVSVTVTLGARTYLYYGLLREYQLTTDGELRQVVLEGAYRSELHGDAEAVKIPGEYFVIDCSDVRTVDVDYWWRTDGEAANA